MEKGMFTARKIRPGLLYAGQWKWMYRTLTGVLLIGVSQTLEEGKVDASKISGEKIQ